MLYLRKFDNHEEYEDYLSGDTMVRPNVARCVEERDVHYKPVSYVYMRSNMKTAENTVKIKFENNMKLNVMDYLYTPSAYIPPYCGYALIENTDIGDNGVANPTITTLLTENPYSFTPQEGKTYAVIQQAVGTNGILYPYEQWVFNSSTNVLRNYFIICYVPNNVNRAGLIINGDEYANDSSDSTKKVTVGTSLKIGSKTFRRTNSYVIYFDILNLLKSNNTVEIVPFMVTADNVMVESYRKLTCTVAEGADVSTLKVSDVSSSQSVNPNYPNFITPPSQS